MANTSEMVLELVDKFSISEMAAAWCIAYATMTRFNGKEAAKIAGYAAPAEAASRNKANPVCMEAARYVASKEADGFAVTRERLVEELAAVGFSKLTDVMDIEGDELVLRAGKLSDLPEYVQRSISSVRLITRDTRHGKHTEVRVQLHDKPEALKLLALMVGGVQQVADADDWAGLVIEAPGSKPPDDEQSQVAELPGVEGVE